MADWIGTGYSGILDEPLFLGGLGDHADCLDSLTWPSAACDMIASGVARPLHL
jgi:hypothetical protein